LFSELQNKLRFDSSALYAGPEGGFGGKVGPPISEPKLRVSINAVVKKSWAIFVFMILIFRLLNEEREIFLSNLTYICSPNHTIKP